MFSSFLFDMLAAAILSSKQLLAIFKIELESGSVDVKITPDFCSYLMKPWNNVGYYQNSSKKP